MSIFNRIIQITESKINKLLNQIENPNELLDLSYEKMLENLQDIKTHLTDVVTQQKRLQMDIQKSQEKIAQFSEDAKLAVKAERDGLATELLKSKHQEIEYLSGLEESLTTLSLQVDKLTKMLNTYKQQINAFRHKKEMTKANYTAAKAQVDLNSSMNSMEKGNHHLNEILLRADGKIQNMQAKAAAISSLQDNSDYNNLNDNKDSATEELNKIIMNQSIADELLQLKNNLKHNDNKE